MPYMNSSPFEPPVKLALPPQATKETDLPPQQQHGAYTIKPQLSLKDWKVPEHVQQAIEQSFPNQ